MKVAVIISSLIAMVTVDIHEAKAQLSRLVDRAAKGEPFIIAKAGKPLVMVSALDDSAAPQRLGFLAGEIKVPEDFDRMAEHEIEATFAKRSSVKRGSTLA